MIERTIYSILDWIGDIGGLYDGLRLIADFFMSNYAVAMMKQELLRLFMINQSDVQSNNRWQSWRKRRKLIEKMD